MAMQMGKFVRVILLVVLLKGCADFCRIPSCINYLICGCSSLNAPNWHLAQHLNGQLGIIDKLV